MRKKQKHMKVLLFEGEFVPGPCNMRTIAGMEDKDSEKPFTMIVAAAEGNMGDPYPDHQRW
jgi:exopolysaccharide biosynthesis predicted pyruvyltransferase EpsI